MEVQLQTKDTSTAFGRLEQLLTVNNNTYAASYTNKLFEILQFTHESSELILTINNTCTMIKRQEKYKIVLEVFKILHLLQAIVKDLDKKTELSQRIATTICFVKFIVDTYFVLPFSFNSEYVCTNPNVTTRFWELISKIESASVNEGPITPNQRVMNFYKEHDNLGELPTVLIFDAQESSDTSQPDLAALRIVRSTPTTTTPTTEPNTPVDAETISTMPIIPVFVQSIRSIDYSGRMTYLDDDESNLDNSGSNKRPRTEK